jgi:hypothetical protein
MRRLKVWAGSHGEERAAIEYVSLLNFVHYNNIDPGIANGPATLAGERFIHTNQAFAYPGSPNSSLNEDREANRVIVESVGYYATLDVHLVGGYGLETAYIDREQGVSPHVLGFLASLGMKALVLTEGWGVQAHVPNAALLEYLFLGVTRNREHKPLEHALDTLANDPCAPMAQAGDFLWYQYVVDLHTSTYNPYSQTGRLDRSWLDPLDPLPQVIAEATGHSHTPLHILNWRAHPLKNGYWGETVTPVSVPDDTHWPQE